MSGRDSSGSPCHASLGHDRIFDERAKMRSAEPLHLTEVAERPTNVHERPSRLEPKNLGVTAPRPVFGPVAKGGSNRIHGDIPVNFPEMGLTGEQHGPVPRSQDVTFLAP